MKKKLIELHKADNWLRDVILGGQDGLVNVLGVVLGVLAATPDTKILIAAGLAATFAESISMAAVAYTSMQSERDHFQKELKREKMEMETVPEKETEEVREIYRQKGFDGDLLEEIVKKITSNKEVWLKTMMDDELNLREVNNSRVWLSAVIVGCAAVVGSLIPVFPYFLFDRAIATPLSLAVSGTALFAVGVYEAKSFVGVWWRSGIKMTLIGLGSAVAGYLVGKMFGVS